MSFPNAPFPSLATHVLCYSENRTGGAEITCVHMLPGPDCHLVEDTVMSYWSWSLILSPIIRFPTRIKTLFLLIRVYAYDPVLDLSHAFPMRQTVLWLLLLLLWGEWRLGGKFCLGICSELHLESLALNDVILSPVGPISPCDTWETYAIRHRKGPGRVTGLLTEGRAVLTRADLWTASTGFLLHSFAQSWLHGRKV